MGEAVRTKKQLLHTLQRRSQQLSALDRKYWMVIGEGPIGDKAQELKDKTWAIQAAGFEPVPRMVLSMGFFENFRTRAGIKRGLEKGDGHKRMRNRIRRTRFSSRELETIYNVWKIFGEVPIAIRSSAHGDALGTGIYESEFLDLTNRWGNGPEEFLEAVRRVLASEFSEKAIAYRRNAGLDPGMAVIIEPVFGEMKKKKYPDSYCVGGKPYTERFFGPAIGGVAHTATYEGPGKTIICKGLPTKAVVGRGVTITEQDQGSLRDILGDLDAMFLDGLVPPVRGDQESVSEHGLTGPSKTLRTGQYIEAQVVEKSGVFEPLIKEALDWLFERLRKLEGILGKPQRIEWAAVDGPRVGVVQISDMNMERDFFEFVEGKRTVLKSHYVVGSGQRVCDGVVYVSNPGTINELYEYNQKHEGYVVIYDGVLKSEGGDWDLPYEAISNAACLIDRTTGACHAAPPESHWKGALKSSGKLFMVTGTFNKDVLGEAEIIRPNTDWAENEPWVNMEIYPVKVKVTVSQAQGKGIVELVE